MLKSLRQVVHEATLHLVDNGLVDCFRGNVSCFDRRRGLVVIKPRGVDYGSLTADSYLVVSAQTGRVVEGLGVPSSGIDAHLALYRDLPDIRSVIATHSKYTTMWAQAGRPIPCLGVAHADFFKGGIPITPPLEEEIEGKDYYGKVAEQIVEYYERTNEDPSLVPAILVDGFGLVAWGESPMSVARNVIYIEILAELAYGTLCLNPNRQSFSDVQVRRHFLPKRMLPNTARISR